MKSLTGYMYLVCLTTAILTVSVDCLPRVETDLNYTNSETVELHLDTKVEEVYVNRCDEVTEYVVADNCYQCSRICDLELSHSVFQRSCLIFCKGKRIFKQFGNHNFIMG